MYRKFIWAFTAKVRNEGSFLSWSFLSADLLHFYVSHRTQSFCFLLFFIYFFVFLGARVFGQIDISCSIDARSPSPYDTSSQLCYSVFKAFLHCGQAWIQNLPVILFSQSKTTLQLYLELWYRIFLKPLPSIAWIKWANKVDIISLDEVRLVLTLEHL